MRINEPIAYILLYAALYAAFGVASPFWPKFFETRGLTSQQIGFILAAAMLVRLAAGPLVGRLADVSRSLRLVLATCAALAAAMAAALSNTFWLLLIITSLQAAALAPTTSIADALSVNAAKPQIAGKPFEYGWITRLGIGRFRAGHADHRPGNKPHRSQSDHLDECGPTRCGSSCNDVAAWC